ncbi:MAG: helix-turn-helix domain-containing protein, partial [Thermotogaceae bacterium]|nr:helix-turn-helix domain-containing protein [Thermotogaceae bacterium]
MTISEEIRMLCGRFSISIAELARRTGQSPQNLSSKLKRGSFTVSELEAIAKATGT